MVFFSSHCVVEMLIFFVLFCFLVYRKTVQGEIKIQAENGETRVLRSAPDWTVSFLFSMTTTTMINDYDYESWIFFHHHHNQLANRNQQSLETIYGYQHPLRVVIFVMLAKINAL